MGEKENGLNFTFKSAPNGSPSTCINILTIGLLKKLYRQELRTIFPSDNISTATGLLSEQKLPVLLLGSANHGHYKLGNRFVDITSSKTKGRLGNRFVEIISSRILLKFNNGGRLGSSITPIPPSLCRGLKVVKKDHSRTHNSYSFGSEVSLRL